jgi:hypothetical protein
MQQVQEEYQPRILVIQDEFVSEMRLALEYAGLSEGDMSAMKDQVVAILQGQGISAAIVDNALEQQAAMHIADALVDLHIPFVFAGKDEQSDIPQHVVAYTMTPAMANLTVIAQSILGKPTFH